MADVKLALLLALLLALALPATASAKLSAMKVPPKQPCQRLAVGVHATKKHKGNRKIEVLILSRDRIWYDRVLKAPLGDTKTRDPKVPCGKTYVVNYIFPSGGVLAYKTRVTKDRPDSE